MTSTQVQVLRGVPVGQRRRAAELFWEAFAAKLAPALGDRERGVALLEATLGADRLLCAVTDGRLVGVLGYHESGRGAFDLAYRDLVAHYSRWSAWLRVLLLAPLDRTPRRGELLLDGICVDASARGSGIGTRLLDAAVELAQDHGAGSIRLSIVDTNPRARALYERHGYVAGRTERFGAIGQVYGASAATSMVRPVEEEVR